MFELLEKKSIFFSRIKDKFVLTSLCLAVVGASCSVISTVAFLQKSNTSFQTIETHCTQEEIDSAVIAIDISGAVKNPGIHTVLATARTADAVATAGGLLSTADMQYVSSNINLAKPIQDSEKIYIPFDGEKHTESLIQNDVGLISINAASQTELETLEGIGEKRADDIIKNRPYSSIQDLVVKGVLGETLLENIKNKITI